MVSVENVKLGINKFIDKNIISGYNGSGWQRVVVPAVVSMAVNSYADKLINSELVSSLGIIKDGMVELDVLASEIKKRISDSGMVVEISMLGSATFYRADVDELMRMIKEGY